ncbi:MAG: acetyl-CoA C-acyltransferase [Alphaproteobacteria bacterium]
MVDKNDQKNDKIVIAGYARTAFQPAKKGKFVKIRPDDLAAAAVKGLIAHSKLDPALIEDLLLGCAFPEAEQGFNMARMVVLLSGLPISVGGATINRFCGSSMQSAHSAAGAISLGAGDLYIAAGVESMSRVPLEGFNPMPNPVLATTSPGAYSSMGQTAENIAKACKIDRKRQEEFAVLSHQKAGAAQQAGHFKAEIVDLDGIAEDGCIRPDTNLDDLAGLKPAFDAKGTVTAGTSSPLTDGAVALFICKYGFAVEAGLTPLAAIKSFAVSGCKPEMMGLGPIESSKKALARAGLTASDLDLVEINEAFSAQAIASIDQLGLDMARVNLDGGALALGHPLGATGARILGKAASLLQREDKQFALATQCIGGGQGIATILERV